MRGGDEPEQVDIDLRGADVVSLEVGDAGDGPVCDHADWAEAKIVTQNGKTYLLDQLPQGADSRLARYPFSFTFADRHSDELLVGWQKQQTSQSLDLHRTKTTTTWTDRKTGLRLQWEVTRMADFLAVEWVLWLENCGTADTPIVADVLPLDLTLDEPMGAEGWQSPRPDFSSAGSTGPDRTASPFPDCCYLLHRTNGAPTNPTDFEPRLVPLARGSSQTMRGAAGARRIATSPSSRSKPPRRRTS